MSLFERIKDGEVITWVSSSKQVVKQRKEVQVQENPVQEEQVNTESIIDTSSRNDPNYIMVAADINTSSNQSDPNKIWVKALVGN